MIIFLRRKWRKESTL